MSPNSPFPVNIDLSSTREDSTITTDSNVFYPEVNKIVARGRIRKERFWVKCDGGGRMDFIRIADPIKEIERLGKLKDMGLITDEQFEKTKRSLLDRV